MLLFSNQTYIPSSSLSIELPFYLWPQCTTEISHFPRPLASREDESEGHVTQFGSMGCADVISEFLRKLLFFFLVFLLFLFCDLGSGRAILPPKDDKGEDEVMS